MRSSTIKHEDNRRVLTEWITNADIKMCKVIEVKKDSVLGIHYHRDKEDFFYLLKGKGSWVIGKEAGLFNEGDKLYAPKNTVHTIFLVEGSILLEASTTPFNPDDEIPATE